MSAPDDHLVHDFPGCVALMVTALIDRDIPGHVEEWAHAQQRLQAEMRRLQ